MVHRRISSQDELDTALRKAKGKVVYFFIALNFGLRSSKDIRLTGNGDYHIYNEIDDTSEEVSHDDLMGKTMIGEAISKGAFYMY